LLAAETDNDITLGFQPCIALIVAKFHLGKIMNATIHLNDETCLVASEVSYVASDGSLPTHVQADLSQGLPENLLR
jgi:hypothetical protein